MRLQALLPDPALQYLKGFRLAREKAAFDKLPPLTESQFAAILHDRLNVRTGDVVFVHSSLNRLRLTFPFTGILKMLRDAVGQGGTLVFATYPKHLSYDFLRLGEVFDVRKTPSYTGILNDFARRQPGTLRSLHPTKSVCALGPAARTLTDAHHTSPYPFSKNSPYFRLTELRGKAIGLGVATSRLSFVHCVDDAMGHDFPVDPYHDQLFRARCIDGNGDEAIVPTYAHHMSRMKHDVPRFMRNHIERETCEDVAIGGMQFFRADAAPLFERMTELARAGVTVYHGSVYRKR